MTDSLPLIRKIGEGAVDFAHLPVALGAIACNHVAAGDRPACNISIEDGDVSAVCEDRTCFDKDGVITSLFRILHFAPDVCDIGPAESGWSFTRFDASGRWLAWPPGATEPVEVEKGK